ncbi:MAG: PfkB family carbohydrate kinase [Deltaproteobacteria bacterium]|nr:PfkB family carbohydrate kinase [Deltaproteobacteria bacterium]
MKKNLLALGLGQASLDVLTYIDRQPKPDSKLETSGFLIQGGGPAATALVTLKRLGVKARFIGVTGDDDASALIIKGLRDEGVDTLAVIRRKHASSQLASIIVDTKAAHRTILWKRPSALPLKASEISPAAFKGASILLIDGLMKEASVKAAKIAREKGIPVLLDAGRMRPGMRELIKLSTHIVGSEVLSKDIAKTPEAALRKLRAINRTAELTITLGKKGSITLIEDKVIKTPAFKVTAIDTTGAGDVFHGAYAYGIITGMDIKATITFASAVSALKCTKRGGRTGIPSLKETVLFMRRAVNQ